jgi:serpin B
LRRAILFSTAFACPALGCASDQPDTHDRSGALGVKVERSATAPDTAPRVPEADYQAFISNLNQFGLDIGQRLAGTDEYRQSNLVYSPLSAAVALSMAYAGARGTTAAEMKAVLGDTFAGDTFHVANNRLSRELASRAHSMTDSQGKSRKVELSLVDSLWTEQTLPLEAAFLDLLSREYDCGVRRVDFMHAFEPARQNINTWVADQTKDKIQDLLPKGALTDNTRVVLVNALYFYGSWSQPFSHESTADATFHRLSDDSVRVPTMNGQAWLRYADHGTYLATELPYDGNKLFMTLVLPAAGKLDEVRAQVTPTWLEQLFAGPDARLVNIALPKFKFSAGTFSLKASLENMGMKAPFRDDADFTGITPANLSISDVLQKAFVAVDEDGTEAAAATAVVIGATAARVDQPVPFIADRPFLFFVRDATAVVLFAGQVTDPSHS